MKLEIRPRLFSKNFRWIEFNFWKKRKDDEFYFLKLHIKLPLTIGTWKTCWRGFPGSVWVMWEG